MEVGELNQALGEFRSGWFPPIVSHCFIQAPSRHPIVSHCYIQAPSRHPIVSHCYPTASDIKPFQPLGQMKEMKWNTKWRPAAQNMKLHLLLTTNSILDNLRFCHHLKICVVQIICVDKIKFIFDNSII